MELRRLKKKLKAKEQANLETRALAKKQSKDTSCLHRMTVW